MCSIQQLIGHLLRKERRTLYEHFVRYSSMEKVIQPKLTLFTTPRCTYITPTACTLVHTSELRTNKIVPKKTQASRLVKVVRHASRVVRPAVLPDEPHVRRTGLGGRVGPPLQPQLDSPEVHGPLDDVGVVVKSEPAPVDGVSESLGVGRTKQGVDQLRVFRWKKSERSGGK